MKRNLLIQSITGLGLTIILHAADFGTVPDPYTGNWSGTLTAGDRQEPLHATVVASKARFEVTLRSKPGPREKAIVVLTGNLEKDRLVLQPSAAAGETNTDAQWSGQADGNQFTGTIAGRETGTFSLNKVPFQPSATLGEKAPSGATVLFDGSSLEAWETRKEPAAPIQWIVKDTGALEVVSLRDGKKNKQDLKTKAVFGDYRLHLEFKLAHKPEASGQSRSNSGIFHLGIHETQILDSFGQYGRNNDCGGIYKFREPDSNAGYPAGLWQTYDIEVKAPRIDEGGKKTADARMTVRLNGVLVHDDVALPAAESKESAKGPIILQDHGNPVQFRNIWVVESD